MTRQEHLLTHITEECAEVAQRVTKALRFGEEQKQSEQPLTNRERIIDEVNDLAEVLSMAGYSLTEILDRRKMAAKREKVERYLLKAQAQGTLQVNEP